MTEQRGRCQWGGCRRAGTHLSEWPNGAEARHCEDHAKAVQVSLAHPDALPGLAPEQRVTILGAAERFRRQMQTLVDKGDTGRITVRFGSDPEIVVAEKKADR